MAQPTPLFVGLDVHKDSIAVAHAQGQSADPPVFVGEIGTRRRTWRSSCAGSKVRRPIWFSRMRPGRAVTACIAT